MRLIIGKSTREIWVRDYASPIWPPNADVFPAVVSLHRRLRKDELLRSNQFWFLFHDQLPPLTSIFLDLRNGSLVAIIHLDNVQVNNVTITRRPSFEPPTERCLHHQTSTWLCRITTVKRKIKYSACHERVPDGSRTRTLRTPIGCSTII